MRAGNPSSLADQAYDLTLLDGRVELDFDFTEVAIHRNEPLTMINQHGVAVEKIITGGANDASGGGLDGRALWCCDIQARVRASRLVIQNPAFAKGR